MLISLTLWCREILNSSSSSSAKSKASTELLWLLYEEL